MAGRSALSVPVVTAERARRDIRWVLSHAPLVAGAAQGDEPWLGDAELSELRQDLAGEVDAITDAAFAPALSERRSGRYFEALLVALIQVCRRYDLLAENLQVFADKRTLGAFDLIVREAESGCVTHLELAFKQYLHREGRSAEMHRWVGPRGRDRLDIKGRHMVAKQLKLGTTPAGQAALADLGVDRLHRTRALMAGRLFIHFEHFRAGDWPELPDICSHKLRFGWWANETEIVTLKSLAEGWRVLTPQWAIAPLNAEDCSLLPEPRWDEVHEQVQRGIPALVAAVENGEEVSRGWIVQCAQPHPTTDQP